MYLSMSRRKGLWKILTRCQMFTIKRKMENHFSYFGNIKAKNTLKDFDEVSNIPKKRHRRKSRRRKVNECALRDQELEIEKDNRKEQRHTPLQADTG